jgi:hypothetical protein
MRKDEVNGFIFLLKLVVCAWIAYNAYASSMGFLGNKYISYGAATISFIYLVLMTPLISRMILPFLSFAFIFPFTSALFNKILPKFLYINHSTNIKIITILILMVFAQIIIDCSLLMRGYYRMYVKDLPEEEAFRVYTFKGFKKNRGNIATNGKAFYQSKEWKALRLKVFSRYGTNHECFTPGCTSRGTHVDHIKPRSKYPHLALNIDNMQLLCPDCNRLKSDKYENLDFRELRNY